MPTYDYHCPANGRTVEVKHAMSEKLRTWGELCALAGMSIEATPAETPVAKQLAATGIGGGVAKAASLPALSAGGGCGSGGCGHRH